MKRQGWQRQALYLGAISFGVKAEEDFQPGIRRTNASQTSQDCILSRGHGSQQTSPGKVYVDLVSSSFEFSRKRLDCSLYKQNVGQTALRWFSVNFFGDFLQGSTVSVNTDEERFRILTRPVVDEESVSSPNIDYDLFVRSNECIKISSIDLSEGSTAD